MPQSILHRIGLDGRRLAKRHGDTRLFTLRESGVPAERLVGLLAWSCGLLDQPRPAACQELREMGLLALAGGKWKATSKNVHLPSDHTMARVGHAIWRAHTLDHLQHPGEAPGRVRAASAPARAE